MRLIRLYLSAVAAGLTVWLAAFPAAALDWSRVTGRDVVLLFPGQTSWEWNLSEADHSAAGKFKQGENCAQCHRGEERRQGDLLVSGKKAEPNPIAGFPGYVVTNVKFAYDAVNFYIRMEFKEPTAPDTKMDADFATKVAVIFNDPGVPEGRRAGCWASCHEDNASMPAASGSERVKYLVKTRAKLSRQGGGDQLKSPDDLARLMDGGYVQEWWQAQLNPGAKARTISGIIFDKRQELKPSPVSSEATFANGVWTVVMSRPLNAPAPYRPLLPDRIYSIGFSIHLGHAAKRFHHTSYEFSLAFGQGPADFIAAKQ